MSDLEKELIKALKPFANAVYNDNGDVSVSYHAVDIGDWFRAYKILKRLEKNERS